MTDENKKINLLPSGKLPKVSDFTNMAANYSHFGCVDNLCMIKYLDSIYIVGNDGIYSVNNILAGMEDTKISGGLAEIVRTLILFAQKNVPLK